jgi:hypothetical protein
MKKTITAIFCATIVFAQSLLGNNYAMSKEYYLIPTTDDFKEYLLDGNEFKLIKSISFEKIRNFAWPNYNKSNHDLYFAGLPDEGNSRTNYIYKYNASKKPNLETLIKGSNPSLSPDGQWLAYYQHPNKLWTINLESKQKMKLVDDIANLQPPVWVSNNSLLYYSSTNQLIILDIIRGDKRKTGHEMVIPGSLSPDGNTVLCSSSHSNKIFIYSIDTNKLETIKESNILSIGSNFIWRPDGKSFLYTRQTLANVLRFREMGDLFLFSIDDRAEKQLLKWFHFFGGVEVDF